MAVEICRNTPIIKALIWSVILMNKWKITRHPTSQWAHNGKQEEKKKHIGF